MNGYSSETNVNMTFYDRNTGEVKYNYDSTLEHQGNPDTLVIDPLPIYRIVVHTVPQAVKGPGGARPGNGTVGIDTGRGSSDDPA